MSPSGDIVQGSSVTFTCTSDANPPVTLNGYSLFKDGQFMSSGQSHTISDVLPSHSGLYLCQAWNNISWKGQEFMKSTEIHLDASHTGLYICQARNSVGQSNSTEVLLTMKSKELGAWHLPVLAGVGAFVLVALVIALILFWRNHRTCAKEKETALDSRLSGRGSSSSANENELYTVYANIHTFQPNPPLVPAAAAGMASHSQRKSHHGYNLQSSYEAEVTYSSVTIKPRNQGLQHHMSSSRATQDSRFEAGANSDCVIYTTVAESR
ncbi:hypothetical protein INR49_012855 [Caranx melampygus]|nr:hypothetical protein INR49_012855 [Caranx melampygus]